MSRAFLDKIAFAAFSIFALAALFVGVLRLDFNADLTESLRSSSDAYTSFAAHRERFGDDTRDVVLAVRSGDVLPPAALEDVLIELQLTVGVRDVFSLFTLTEPESPRSFLKSDRIAGLAPAEQFALMRETIPFASGLVSEDGRTTLFIVQMDDALGSSEFAAALAPPLAMADPTLEITRVGTPRLEAEINDALMRDQLTITPLAVVLGLVLIFVIFRSWRAVVICGLPIIMALAVCLGALAVTGTAMSPLLSLVPVILIVLGFADSIHYFHAICRRPEQETAAAVTQARREILPAIVSTTLTTVLAFLVMLWIDSEALRQLAIVGSLGMIITLLVVATLVPLLARLLLTRQVTAQSSRRFHSVLGLPVRLLSHAGVVSAAALALLALLIAAQPHVVTGYDPFEHVPRASSLLDELATLEEDLPGSGRHNVFVPATGESPEADAARLARASEALLGQPVTLPDEIDAPRAVQRLVATDGSGYSIPVPTSILSTPGEIAADVARLRDRLGAVGLEVADVTGYAILAAEQLPVLVDGLRTAFYIAIALMTLGIALVLRSAWAGLVTLVPNLLPILGIEAWMVLTGQTVTITASIALLVAFGIAVDNTIHVINRVRLKRREGMAPEAVIEQSLAALISPIMTTSLLLIAGFALTAFSALPAVGLFGALTAQAIVIALLADLLLFPALLLVLLRKDRF